jgi:hypothetical protein
MENLFRVVPAADLAIAGQALAAGSTAFAAGWDGAGGSGT